MLTQLLQSCLTVCNPMDCSLPGSSVHRISQARILEWVAISSSRDLPDPGIKPASPASPELQADSLLLSHQGRPLGTLLLSHFRHSRLCVTPRWQPTRLRRPWDSPGKNTGVGCHFLLQCMKVKSKSEVAQSCPTLRNHMDYCPPGSSVHGIFQQEYWSGVPLDFRNS